jgi:high-affinity iron transporter
VLASRLAQGTLRPMIGLGILGFMVVYREGFETVLFLQAAKAQAGGGAVAAGVLLGTAVTAAIGVLMLILRRRLPYRQVVVVAAILVGIMAVALTGQTARSMQAAGWLAITPVPIALPAWMGLWLGLYASVQTLGAQLLVIIAIASGRVVSERLRARRLARRLRAVRAARPPRATTKRPVGVATPPDVDEARASADAAPPRVPAAPRS